MPDPEHVTGTVFAARYRIERELGRGGMAIVYLAHDLKHDRDVALKVLRSEHTQTVGTERFLREIRIAARLTHPHILPLHDSGESDGLLYYVMPFVKGDSLRDHLVRTGALPLEEAIRITLDVVSALEYAHGEGIVHRDIKPENVLLSQGGAVVADFGIARAMTLARDERLTETGLSVGTPLYVSPEQVSGGERLDGRSDVYSLGCVLYEMLNGEPPFSGAARVLLNRKMVESPPSLRGTRGSVSPALDSIIQKALSPNPADRWKSAAAFGDALRRETGDVERSLPPHIHSRSRRLTPFVAGVAAVLGLAVIVTIWRLTTTRGITGSPASGFDSHSVAVVPFDIVSSDSAEAYLANGLTEEMISRLGKVPTLRVKRAAREFVRRLRDSVPDYLPALGKALGVQSLVTGSVRRGADSVRIIVQLINASTGFRIWGDEYNREPGDLLEIETGIAVSVTNGIVGYVSPNDSIPLQAMPTRNAEAYERLLRGNFYLTPRTLQGYTLAIREYQEALRLDPRFVRARARMAYTYGLCSNWGLACFGLGRDSLIARGLAAADSALKTDSTTSDAWLALGLLRIEKDPRSLAGATEAIDRAVALDPTSAEGHHGRALVNMLLGNDSIALAAYNTALTIEPIRPQTLRLLSSLNQKLQRYDEALKWIDSAVNVAVQPDPEFFLQRGAIRRLLGDTAGARRDAELVLRGDSTPLHANQARIELALLRVRDGDSVKSRQLVERAVRDLAGTRTAGNLDGDVAQALATGLSALNDRARAIAFLERVQPSALFWYSLKDPDLDALRREPRFQALYSRTQPR